MFKKTRWYKRVTLLGGGAGQTAEAVKYKAKCKRQYKQEAEGTAKAEKEAGQRP